MKVLVTGASGFLGRAVVRKALDAGHTVLAMVRPASDPEFADSARLTIVRGDLRQRGNWCPRVAEAEVVIHCAAAPTGDLAEQFAGTVLATENLLACLPAGLSRFVHISSFSVYDFASLRSGATLDENSPIEPRPEARDAYTWTKLLQERMVRDHCDRSGLPLVVIRPGAIYGPGKDWDFGRALALGKLDLVFAPLARSRFTFVDNCADAIVAAATVPEAAGKTFNIVDDDLPSNAGYHRACRRAGAPAGAALPVPWAVVAAAGWLVRLVNRTFCGGRARLPEFLDYRRQQARWKPLRYSNALARRALGWSPRVPIAQAITVTVGQTDRREESLIDRALADGPAPARDRIAG